MRLTYLRCSKRVIFRCILFTFQTVFHLFGSGLSLTNEINAHDDSFFTLLLHRYLIFDDEMTKVSSDWRECYQLIEQYNDEQVGNLYKLIPSILCW